MRDWSQIVTAETLNIYEPVATDYYADQLYDIFQKYLPTTHNARWQSVWCDGNEMTEGGSDRLAEALLYTSSKEYFQEYITDSEYLRGNVGRDQSGNVVWISWGIGCPMDSGCDEILVVEYSF